MPAAKRPHNPILRIVAGICIACVLCCGSGVVLSVASYLLGVPSLSQTDDATTVDEQSEVDRLWAEMERASEEGFADHQRQLQEMRSSGARQFNDQYASQYKAVTADFKLQGPQIRATLTILPPLSLAEVTQLYADVRSCFPEDTRVRMDVFAPSGQFLGGSGAGGKPFIPGSQ